MAGLDPAICVFVHCFMTRTIRPGRSDEAEVLRAIERAAQQGFAQVGYPDLADGDPVPAAILHQAARDGLLLVAADGDDRPVGFALCAVVDGCLYIHELDVYPDHAGQRLGASLLDAAAGLARQRHLPALTLTTFRHVPWNAPYYTRLGFTEIGADEIGPELQRVLERQRAAGLDMANRLAMKRPV